MLIGVTKEIKVHEYRVGLLPASVRELTAHGHAVLIETGAAAPIGFSDKDFTEAGARIAPSAQAVFADAEMIVKVKEPQPGERSMLRPGQVLFTYLHLAPDPDQARDLLASGATCIAYETVTSPHGGLPLLAPMSEVAGRMAVQAGAHCLEKEQGGLGILLGGVPGVAPANVVIIGGGVVGRNAAQIAIGMAAHVTVIDRSVDVLRDLDRQFGASLRTAYATRQAIDELVTSADLVIGAVLIPGAAAPKLVSADMIRRMQAGAVVVDVAIDQGGCFETSRPTTHREPTYTVDGVIHYCVANMPGAVPRTSTFALNNATLIYVLALADKGVHKAMMADPFLRQGLNVHAGKLTNAAVANALKLPYMDAKTALGV